MSIVLHSLLNLIRFIPNQQKSITLHVKGVAQQYISNIKPTTAFEVSSCNLCDSKIHLFYEELYHLEAGRGSREV